ncbi:MAG: Trm112 family protein [Mesorhizobium sp.]
MTDQLMTDTGKIDIKLLELLCCPLTHGNLTFDVERQELVSKTARLAYPVRDGIPIMLPSEARQIEID